MGLAHWPLYSPAMSQDSDRAPGRPARDAITYVGPVADPVNTSIDDLQGFYALGDFAAHASGKGGLTGTRFAGNGGTRILGLWPAGCAVLGVATGGSWGVCRDSAARPAHEPDRPRTSLIVVLIRPAQQPAAVAKAHDGIAIVSVDLIGRICGHDVVGAGELLGAEPVFGDFIDGEGKVGVEERHFFGVGQIDDMLFLADCAKEDAFPAVDPCGDSAPVQLSLCLVANLPFILVANQHWPA